MLPIHPVINYCNYDGNGFADDFIGWDMVADDNDPDHNSGEDHGTHCSGIAAGMTNNEVGIASISWNVKTMPIRFAIHPHNQASSVFFEVKNISPTLGSKQ